MEENEPSLNWTSLLLLLILLALVAFGAFYFGKGRKEIPTPEATTSGIPSPLGSPSASPAI